MRNEDSYLRGEAWGTMFAPPTPDYPTDGLVSRWTLDNTLEDSGGNGYDLSVLSGSAQYAVSTSGTGDFVLDLSTGGADVDTFSSNETAWSIYSGTNSWTFSTWVFQSSTFANQGVFAFSANSTAPNYGSGDDYNMFRTMVFVSIILGGQRSQGAGGTHSDWSGSIDKDNQWAHLLVTYNGSVINSYVNNVADVINYGSAQSLSAQNYFVVGKSVGGAVGGAQKMYTQYMYNYDRVLDSDERATLYNSGTPI